MRFWCLQTDNILYSGAYASIGVDNSLQLDNFRDNFKVEVIRLTKDDMEFDMIGIDPAIANAFRRILIAEVCMLCSLCLRLEIIIILSIYSSKRLLVLLQNFQLLRARIGFQRWEFVCWICLG